MKKNILLPTFLLLSCLGLAVWAQDASVQPTSDKEILENADTADGTHSWRGDCKPAGSDETTDLVSNDANTKGVLVDLRSSRWSTVTQEIRDPRGSSNTPTQLTITYQVSTDFSLSTRQSDYTGDPPKAGISSLLGFSASHIFGRPGQILAFIDAAPENRVTAGTVGGTMIVYFDHVSMQSFAPDTGGPKTFTIPIQMPKLNGQDNPTFCIAIPPGSGSITFTKISLQKLGP